MNVFQPADILLPKVTDFSRWAVIACDQFTSDPAYWQRVRDYAGDAPSACRLILPEVELGTPAEAAHTAEVHATMNRYLKDGLFQVYDHAYVYVERTLENGSIRKGLVGMVDLETYSYEPGSTAPIRATERTVESRIPPRMKIRQDAPLEFPHVLMLCDDSEKVLIEPLAAQKETLPKLYDFDLMEGGGHITGWLVQGEAVRAFDERLTEYSAHVGEKYQDLQGTPMILAAGDGNHSLATAKACYEALKKAHPEQDFSNHPARFALAELENIHDEALDFEPIHRVLFHVDQKKLLSDLKRDICAEDGFPLTWYAGTETGTVYLDKNKGQLAVGILQSWLDHWLQNNAAELDYIHDDDELRRLAQQENAVGFLLPTMEKSQLFRGVIADGVLPRKTFSMGHAREKRYYLEGRAIR